MAKRYKIDEMLKIKNPIELPKETIDIINILANTVGANTYSKAPVFQKKKEFKKKESIDDFNFKKTELNKENVDKNISELRSLLNKLTNNNYEKIKPKLEEHINAIIEKSDKKEIDKIGNFIFETASSNKFYSEIYATLYGEIITKHDILKNILDDSINTYMVLFENIELVDPKIDYDKFCKNNIINDKRKAMSLFITNLMNKEVLNIEVITNMVDKLHILLENNIDEIENKKIIEEIVENLYIIVTNMNCDLKEIKINLTNNLSKYSGKPGLSNKAKFKYMDTIEFIKEN
tara:strand:- start:1726 stop:2598 length:873 start_codon:yes stop_codon:yes gene_type:complete